MKTEHLETMLRILTEKVQSLETELMIKNYTINNLENKIKDHEKQ